MPGPHPLSALAALKPRTVLASSNTAPRRTRIISSVFEPLGGAETSSMAQSNELSMNLSRLFRHARG